MSTIINEDIISNLLINDRQPTSDMVEAVLSKALNLQRLTLEDTAVLIRTTDPSMVQRIYETAGTVKDLIYGNRVVFFAPLYVSNFCSNNCLYCAFRSENRIIRNALDRAAIERETEILLRQGHKRILLVAGEAYPEGKGLDYILDAVDAVYSVSCGKNSIRRVNVNIAPLERDEFARLKARDIGTYQLFQETYHQATYKLVHTSGPKADYEYRLSALDRALDAGFDDVGMGVLFGLYDWKFEVLALLQHIEHLENTFGFGPHTISVPRMEPADGSLLAAQPPYQVSDDNFQKIVAILRLAVPYTGIILSTREAPEMRRELLQLGVSQVSAGSRTNPGGYSNGDSNGQFSLGDHRSLDEVIHDLVSMGFLPSFCTACYRLGRTGLDFMEYAKPGEIKKKCEPNGLLTFQEYLTEFASPQVKDLGVRKLREWTAQLDDSKIKDFVTRSLAAIEVGERDIYL